MNLVQTTVQGGAVRIGDGTAPLPQGVAVNDGTSVIWGARPEYLRWSLEDESQGVPAEVSMTENLGASALITVNSGEDRLQLVVPEEGAPEPGTRGWVEALSHRSLLFDPETTERIN